MTLDSLPPLDIQTESLGRDQYPSGRMLWMVAVVSVGGLLLSWASHRDGLGAGSALAQQDYHRGAGALRDQPIEASAPR